MAERVLGKDEVTSSILVIGSRLIAQPEGCALRWTSRAWLANRSSRSERRLERETGIEPATNSLEGCDSTTELLPPPRLAASPARRFGVAGTRPAPQRSPNDVSSSASRTHQAGLPSSKLASLPSRRSLAEPVSEGWWGGEGSNLRSPKAAGLQPAAIDRSATSPKIIYALTDLPIDELPQPKFVDS